MSKCPYCNHVYCVCPDKINDSFLKDILIEHEKKTSRCEEIKQEIDNIKREVDRHHKYKIRSKPKTVSTKSFFVGEVIYESKSISPYKTRNYTPHDKNSPSPVPSARKTEYGFRNSGIFYSNSNNYFDSPMKVSQAGFSSRKSSRKSTSIFS